MLVLALALSGGEIISQVAPCRRATPMTRSEFEMPLHARVARLSEPTFNDGVAFDVKPLETEAGGLQFEPVQREK